MDSSTSYGELLELWLEEKKGKVKPTSYGTYAMYIKKHLIPTLGDIRVNEIDQDIIQNAIYNWEDNGNLRNGTILSKKTIKEMVGVIKQTLKFYARKLGTYCIELDDLVYSKDTRKDIEIFRKDEQSKIIKAVFKNITPKNVGIALGLLAGLRIGEVCALRWDHIDLHNNTLTIDQTLQLVYLPEDEKSKVQLGTPKSKKSERVIPFGSTLANLLNVLKPEHADNLFVISGKDRPLQPNSLREYYYRFLNKNELPHLKFHSLRHSFGTKCISCGMPVIYLSKIMGHANVTITMDLYCHPQIDDLATAIKDIDSKWL